jgi:ribosomal protein L37AE/L43A
MRYHPAGTITNPVLLRSPNPCAQCGEPLFAARWSEHLSERCIRHVWDCDACGYQFETTVYMAAEQRQKAA